MTMDTIKDTISLGGRKIILERIKDLDMLVDQVSDDLFNVDERLPYWAELWPSSRVLSAYILENPHIFRNKRVLELGCGLGLTSLAVAMCLPETFLATDYEQDALEALKRNFDINSMNAPNTALLDWRRPDLSNRFDVIVASDVAYEQRFFEPLCDLFKRFLADNGEVILAEPNRSVARGFFGKLALQGFIYKKTDRTVIQDGHEIRVTIYAIRRA